MANTKTKPAAKRKAPVRKSTPKRKTPAKSPSAKPSGLQTPSELNSELAALIEKGKPEGDLDAEMG